MNDQGHQLFICWSGERSKQLAKIMKDWLEGLVPGLTAFTSMEIQKGARWFEVVGRELGQSSAGLICLTPESLRSPWIHFEAGNLAHAMYGAGMENGHRTERRIFTYLYQVRPGELEGPLSAYQNTQANLPDTERMVLDMLEALQLPLPKGNWSAHFDRHWKILQKKLENIPPLSVESEWILPGFRALFRRKTFEEPLNECTNQNWDDRFKGVIETLVALEHQRERVERLCPPYQKYLFDDLCSTLDGYAMDLLSLVLPLPRMALNLEGKLDFPENVLRPVERRRRRILQRVLHITHPGGDPVLDESPRYAAMPTLAERKAALIHPFESLIEKELAGPAKDRVILRRDRLERYPDSLWDFDRIIYYIYQEQIARQGEEHSQTPDLKTLSVRADRELEKLQAMDDAGSLVPLYYALRALVVATPLLLREEETEDRLKDLLDELDRYRAGSQRNLGYTQRLADRLRQKLETQGQGTKPPRQD